MNVILYSTGCPQCRVLGSKLDAAGVQYSVVSDEEEMIAKGFSSAPMLEIDGDVMNAQEAFHWLMTL